MVLAGGSGGAKLARGMLDVVGPDELVVIANTGDDLEIYGCYVSPDPDLATFWLADTIDDRGWGLRDDTFEVMGGLRALGVDVWFNLGDRDLAIGIERAQMLAGGRRLTQAQAAIGEALDVKARVLPMSDGPVRTRVLARGRWWPFQEFMIRGGAQGPIDDVDFAGARTTRASPEVLEAITDGACDRHRTLQPGYLDRAHPGPPAAARPTARGARRGCGRQPGRAPRGTEARDRAPHGLGRPSRSVPPASPPTTPSDY